MQETAKIKPVKPWPDPPKPSEGLLEAKESDIAPALREFSKANVELAKAIVALADALAKPPTEFKMTVKQVPEAANPAPVPTTDNLNLKAFGLWCDNQRLQHDYKNLVESYQIANREVEELKAKLFEAKKIECERDDLRVSLKHTEGERDMFVRNCSRLEEASATATAKAKDLERDLLHLREEFDRLRVQRDTFRDTLCTTNRTLGETIKERDELKAQLARTTEELKESCKAANSYLERLERAEKERDDFRELGIDFKRQVEQLVTKLVVLEQIAKADPNNVCVRDIKAWAAEALL